MTICKNCGTVYDEFFGVCPKCGTSYTPEQNEVEASAPARPMPAPVEDESKTVVLSSAALPYQEEDPEATLPIRPPVPAGAPGNTATVMLHEDKPAEEDPEATLPVRPAVPAGAPGNTATVMLHEEKPAEEDPEATLPIRPAVPAGAAENTAAVMLHEEKPAEEDPEATLPIRPAAPSMGMEQDNTTVMPENARPAEVDPEATIPVMPPVNSSIPMRSDFSDEPSATKPVAPDSLPMMSPVPEMPLSEPSINDKSPTQDVLPPLPPIGQVPAPGVPMNQKISKEKKAKKKGGSKGKIIAIFLIIAVVLAGCGVGVYFLFFHNQGQEQHQVDPESQKNVELGNKYLQDEKYEEAKEAFEKAIEIDPKNVDAYIGLAQTELKLGDFDAAQKALTSGYAETRDQRLADALNQMAQEYINQNKLQAAAGLYRQVIEINAQYVDAYINLAQIYKHSGSESDAINTLDSGYAATGDARIKAALDEMTAGRTAYAGTWNMVLDTNTLYNIPAEARAMLTAYMNMEGKFYLRRDGSLTASLSMTGMSKKEAEGTWSVDGNRVTMTINGSSQTWTERNGRLYNESLAQYGDILYLEKLSGDTPAPQSTGSSGGSFSANESQMKADAASLNSACKDYFAGVMAGTISNRESGRVVSDTLPDPSAAASEKRRAALSCTVKGALEYAGLTDMTAKIEAGSFVVDTSDGTIYYKEDSYVSGKTTYPVSVNSTFAELYPSMNR